MADESLEDRIKRLREQTAAAANQRRMDAKYSRAARVREDLTVSGRFLSQVWRGLSWLREHASRWIFQPFFHYVVVPVWNWYKRLWSYVVYTRTRDGVLIFSNTRAGLMLISSFLFFWYLTLPLVEFAIDVPIYAITVTHDEKLFLWSPQEINTHTNSQIIRGCAAFPCSQDNAEYFRVENSLFNNVWSITHGHGLFFPEYVANVPNTITNCKATSYWFRFRLTSRILNIYPLLLSVSCTATKE